MLLLAINQTAMAWDNLHFYRASFFWGEPRFERDKLTTLNVRVGAGASDTARNGCGNKVCLLDLFGNQVMSKLGENVPYKNLSNPQDLTLQLLEQESAVNGFGQFSFSGKFRTVELDLQLYQNIINGFFLEFYMPIRKLEISNICGRDITPECACPNGQSPIWQTFLNQYNAILSQYCLCQGGVNNVGIGDTTALLGWALNYEETTHLDFIDFTVEAGVLFPTGRKANPNIIFDLPQGYNGHYGFPLNVTLALGMYEWLTLGGHTMILPLKSKKELVRMQTSAAQNGFIKLASGCADVHRGSLWQIGGYLKADHAIRNVSLLFGYSYSLERKSWLDPEDKSIFNPSIVNSDVMLQGWNMHTIHLLAEADYLKASDVWGMRYGIFGNLIIGGKRIFNTNMGGAMIGVDIVWSY